jgi:hypothetical protein
MSKISDLDEMWRKVLEARDMANDLQSKILVHLLDMVALELAKEIEPEPKKKPSIRRESRC